MQSNFPFRAIALAVAPITLISFWVNPSSAEEFGAIVIEPSTPVLAEPLEPTPEVSPAPIIASEPQPVSLSILNPSFEEDIVGGDGAVDFATGWQILSNSPWSVGTYRPGSGLYASHVPNGFNVAYANSGSLFQRLTDSLTANTKYTLGFNVGSRPPYGLPGYQVDLLAGETVIATTNSPMPEFGQFIYSELTYTANGVDALLGQPLAIRLSSSGIQVNFDNIHLTSLLLTPPAEISKIVETTITDETVKVASIDPAIAPEGVTLAKSVDQPLSEPTYEIDLFEADLLESEGVFAARMLPATSEVRELAVLEKVGGDDVESVPEPTAVIGLLLSAVALTRLKRNTSHS